MPDKNEEGFVFMGVDVGGVNNIVIRKLINGQKVALFLGKIRDENEILNLMDRYNVRATVIDGLPETRMVERLQAKSNKIYITFFNHATSSIKVSRKERKIVGKRTPIIDRVMENFNLNKYVNPANLQDIPEYYKEMKSSTRILDSEKSPPEYVWVEGNKPDHYFITEAYCELAYEVGMQSNVFTYVDDIVDEEEEKGKLEKESIVKQVSENDSPESALEKIVYANMDFGGRGV